MGKRFKLIVAGGTFDRLHPGHQFFLKKAFSLSERVIIGVTSDKFAEKKLLNREIQPYQERKKAVLAFLKKQKLDKQTTVLLIDDLYGPALKENFPIEGILVTEKTIGGALTINKKRQNLGLVPLKIAKIPLLKTGGDEVVSSVNLRAALLLNQNLLLPRSLRSSLKKPLGKFLKGKEENLKIAALAAKELINNDDRPTLVVTVGDIVSQSFNQSRVPLDLAIVDFKVKRKKKIGSLLELGFQKEKPDLLVKNPAGTISRSLSAVIKKMIKKATQPAIIKVLGEEDLAVLPAILLAPNGSSIFYGQPPNQNDSGQAGEGIVYIKVDDEVKARTFNLLSKFKT